MGSAENGSNSDFLVARFTSDGSLDETFGTHGIVKTSFPGFGNTYSKAEFVALQPDGKIIVYGYARFAYQYNFQHEMALVRYNSDGSIDTGFGTNGRIQIASDVPTGLLLRNDGKMYISSSDNVWRVSASGVIEAGMYVPGIGGFSVDSKNRVIVASTEADSAGYHIAITRLLPNGNSDLSFGTNGKITQKLSRYDYPRTVLVQNDDRILVEASTRESGTDLLIVLRYTP